MRAISGHPLDTKQRRGSPWRREPITALPGGRVSTATSAQSSAGVQQRAQTGSGLQPGCGVTPERQQAVAEVLGGLVPATGRLAPAQLRAITSGLAARRSLWADLVVRDPDVRWYLPLHRSNSCDVWLLAWERGQDTDWHDHGGSSGSFAAAEGCLVEQYRGAGGRRIARRWLLAGEAVAFGPAHVHDVAHGGAGSASAAGLTSDSLPADAPSIDELLAEARGGLARLRPEAAFAILTDGAVLVDIRPSEQRMTEGEVPGAIIIGRNVLEWRLDPRSEARIPALARPDARIIVMCSEGYASTLAAASLRRIGLREATDLDGGFQAWQAAGLPTRPAQPSG